MSGSDLRLEKFKENLGTHLRLRGSTQSLAHPYRNQVTILRLKDQNYRISRNQILCFGVII
jgi:hypothetical protein